MDSLTTNHRPRRLPHWGAYTALFATLAITLPLGAISGDARGEPREAPARARDRLSDALLSSDTQARTAALAELTKNGSSGGDAASLVEAARLLRTKGSATGIAQIARATPMPRGAATTDAYARERARALGGSTLASTVDAQVAAATVAVAHALLQHQEPEASRAIVDLLVSHDGALRRDIMHLIEASGDAGVPTLVRARRAPERWARGWAHDTLDDAQRLLPGDTVRSERADVIANVLLAMSEIGDRGGVSVALAFANTDDVDVRRAARMALETYGDPARDDLQQAYERFEKSAPGRGWSTDKLRTELFAVLDRVRFQEVHVELQAGLDLAKQGKDEAALAKFDDVLARAPTIDARGSVREVYARQGLAWLDNGDPRATRALFTAIRLDPNAKDTGALRAKLAYQTLGQRRGAPLPGDRTQLERVLELDPSHAAAKRDIELLDAAGERAERIAQRWLIVGGVTLACIVLAILFARLPDRRRRTPGASG